MAMTNAERQKKYRNRKRGGPPKGRWGGEHFPVWFVKVKFGSALRNDVEARALAWWLNRHDQWPVATYRVVFEDAEVDAIAEQAVRTILTDMMFKAFKKEAGGFLSNAIMAEVALETFCCARHRERWTWRNLDETCLPLSLEDQRDKLKRFIAKCGLVDDADMRRMIRESIEGGDSRLDGVTVEALDSLPPGRWGITDGEIKRFNQLRKLGAL